MNNKNIWSNEYNPFQKFKTLCFYERMKKIKTGNFDAPVNIALDVCQGTKDHKLCSGYKCNFCMSDISDQGKKAHVPFKILKAIPEFYNKWGVLSICLAGHSSDPLMYKHSQMIEFLRLCNMWNIEVGFVSNGFAYNNLMIEEVARTCKWSGWSINCGSDKVHNQLTGMKHGTFDKIINNMKTMRDYIKSRNLKHTMGYKFLITNENYHEIFDTIKIAKDAGARHFQIRPCELPLDRIKKIDVNEVEKQINAGLELEIPGKFEVFGIREKFNPDFTKKPPKRCIASSLGSTWKADGDIVICPDRRWSAHQPNMSMGNFITEGLEAIRRKWGGPEHIKMIEEANKHIGSCIRCTSAMWHSLYEHVIEHDDMDVTLI